MLRETPITFNPRVQLLQHDLRVFLRTPQVTLSYGAVFALVCELCEKLAEAHIPEGAYLGAYGLSALENILLMLACFTRGSAFVPLNDRESLAQSYDEASRHVPFAALFTGSSPASPALRAAGEMRSRDMQMSYVPEHGVRLSLFSHFEQILPFANEGELAPHAVASVIFTSGSSGERKGVALSFQNHYFSALGTNQFYGLSGDERWLLSLPMFHIGGLMIPLRAMFSGGSCQIPASHAITPQILGELSPSMLSMVPTQLYRLMMAGDMPPRVPACIKAILVGGARCPAAVLAQARGCGLLISVTYGSSEACSQITATQPTATSVDPSEVGELLPYRALRLADGRALLGGKTMFQGYVQHHTLRPVVTDAAGWFVTSDVLAASAHGTGYRFTERTDDVMMIAGENIAPEQIEQALASDLPYGLLCKVVPQADHEYGARPVLLVFARERPDGAWLRGVIDQRLATLKRPRRILWCHQMDHSLYKLSTRECLALLSAYQTGNCAGSIEEI